MRYRNGRYARQISRNINSGIYLGPTQGLSSPKNNRRACLCTDRDTYSRDCCNGNLIAQGVGNIQAPADTISTSTTTTTSGPTTTSTTTLGPTTTSTTSTSTSTSTTTMALYPFVVGVGGSSTTSCTNAQTGNTTTVYANAPTLAVGVRVFSNAGGTIPLSNSFISQGIGFDKWFVGGGTGTIQGSDGICAQLPTTTTTSTTSTSTSTSTTTVAPTTTSTSTTSTSTSTTTIAPTSTTTTTAAPLPIVEDGLIIWNHYTDYNTGSGTISDRSGKGNTALVSGSTMSLTGSSLEFGYAFNGTDNYFTYPEPVNSTPTGSYTLQFYGTFNFDGQNRDYFAKNDFDNGWGIPVTPEFGGNFVYRPIAGGDKPTNANVTGASNKLVTMTFNDDTNIVQLYVNTTLADTNSNGSNVEPFNSASAVPFTFGYNPQGDATYFKGSWKDITLYNRILTSGEITTNYNALSSL